MPLPVKICWPWATISAVAPSGGVPVAPVVPAGAGVGVGVCAVVSAAVSSVVSPASPAHALSQPAVASVITATHLFRLIFHPSREFTRSPVGGLQAACHPAGILGFCRSAASDAE